MGAYLCIKYKCFKCDSELSYLGVPLPYWPNFDPFYTFLHPTMRPVTHAHGTWSGINHRAAQTAASLSQKRFQWRSHEDKQILWWISEFVSFLLVPSQDVSVWMHGCECYCGPVFLFLYVHQKENDSFASERATFLFETKVLSYSQLF